MSEFWDAYKDPRWQRRRLEVMQRDDFRCQECLATEKTLNVHHMYYGKNMKPWEYEAGSLVTLCEDCHKAASNLLGEAKRVLGHLSSSAIEMALGYLKAREWYERYDADSVIEARSYAEFAGICDAFHIIGKETRASLANDDSGGSYRPWGLHRMGVEQGAHLETFYERNRAARAAKQEGDGE